MKQCRRCKEIKPFTEYHRASRLPDGHQPVCKQCAKVIDKRKYEIHKDDYKPVAQARYKRTREDHLKRGHYYCVRTQFGLSADEYDQLVRSQGGCCAICGLAETSIDPQRGTVRQLSLDHNHTTGRVRELLCGRCNRVLGMLHDDLHTIDRLYAYLVLHNKKEIG